MSNKDTKKIVASEKETELKIAQQETQLEIARLDLRKRKRDDRAAAESARIDLRQKQIGLDKAEIELKNTQRAAAIAQADEMLHGRYTFYAGVNSESCRTAIAEMNKLSRLNPGKPLTITLMSPGGSVLDGLALYDHIRDLSKRGHKMTVVVRGMAASMGGILLSAGDVRVIGRESLVLIHEVGMGAFGKIGEITDQVNFGRKLWVKLAHILAARSTMTADEIMQKAHKYDWWLDADEAIKFGFADRID
jgi:ATP-dependent Clp endopeptidase proteolytic subunit ClpP